MKLPAFFLKMNLKLMHAGVQVAFSWYLDANGIKVGIKFALSSLSPIEIIATDPTEDAKAKAAAALRMRISRRQIGPR
jgi:hypothetical protein